MQELAHRGSQDAWFTGNPKRSLFFPIEPSPEVYVQESFEVPFDTNRVSYGERYVATLPRYGDRISDVTLKMTLPQLEIPTTTSGWVYPEPNIQPGFRVYFKNSLNSTLSYTTYTSVYYSTIDPQWLPQSSNVTIVPGTTNFQFVYDSTVASFGFLQDDASFFGFDYRNAASRQPVQAGVYIYIFSAVTQSPFTYEQSGWISGYLPSPVASPYVDSVGTFILRTAELLVGGQTIDTVTGEYIELCQDLEIPYENQAALTLLTGKNDTSSIRSDRTYYVTLPFTREMQIPIRDLYKQDVQVRLTFDTFGNITPLTNQQPQNYVYYDTMTGQNSSGLVGIPYVDPTYGPITISTDSTIWDGRYIYIFSQSTLVQTQQTVLVLFVYDTNKNIITDSTAVTSTLLSALVVNNCVTHVGTTIYSLGLTQSAATIYSMTANGPVPNTKAPVPLVTLPTLGSVCTLTTNGSNLYATSTVNDSYVGSTYNNVFVYNIASGTSTNLVPTTAENVNFSVPPVFDGRHIWYADKYQSANIYRYSIQTNSWNVFNYTTLLSIPQENIGACGYDGTSVYFFTDQTLTASLTLGTLTSAISTYWIAYNTVTTTWSSFDWTSLGTGFSEPQIKQATFDGRYMTLISYTHPFIIQYDTTKSFSDSASYTYINYATDPTISVPNVPKTLGSTIYDGRFYTFFPYGSQAEIVLRYDTAPPVDPTLLQASLIVKYDKLPDDAQLPSRYLIGQTSMSQGDAQNIVLKTVSSGPVKEMMILNQNPTTAQSPYEFTTQSQTIHMYFNHESIVDYTSWVFEPYTYHRTMPQRNVTCFSFSCDPENPMPTGTVNFSRLRTVELEYPYTTNTYTRIYTRSYNVFDVRYGIGGLKFNSPQWYDMSSINGRWSVYNVSQIFVG